MILLLKSENYLSTLKRIFGTTVKISPAYHSDSILMIPAHTLLMNSLGNSWCNVPVQGGAASFALLEFGLGAG